MLALTIQVPDINCGGCKSKIEKMVGEVPGVVAVSADVETKSVHVQGVAFDDAAAVKAAIATAGYTAGDVVPA